MNKSQTKKFAPRNGLTHSMAHHLMAAAQLTDKFGYARVSDIARCLELTRGSVSVAMKALITAGYLEQDDNSFFHFTKRGRAAVESIRTRHQIVEEFFAKVLELPAESAHRESCRIEYLLEGPTTKRLNELIKFWNRQDLQGTLAAAAPAECALCDEADRTDCPCCGLECLSESCQRMEAAELKA